MLKQSLWDYNDACILVSGTTENPNTGTTATPNNRKKTIVKIYNDGERMLKLWYH